MRMAEEEVLLKPSSRIQVAQLLIHVVQILTILADRYVRQQDQLTLSTHSKVIRVIKNDLRNQEMEATKAVRVS